MSIKIGISACVLGEKVRFDGGHKASNFCTQQLANWVQFVPVCPEQAIGLGVPRPAIRLQRNAQHQIRLVQTKDTSLDYTGQMLTFTEQLLPRLAQLSGYIVCAKSPTCGMERVKLYDEQGQNLGKVTVGLYTQQLMQRYPWLPVEEDGRLQDPLLRENFICRVFSLDDYQQSMADGFTVGKLVKFHSRYKFLIMSHNPVAYRELGRLVASASLFKAEELSIRYITDLMQAMQHIATRKNHANTLQHLQGFFKTVLSPSSKQQLSDTIHRYRQGFLPLMAPVTLLQHHLLQHPNAYLSSQRYLQPYPEQLGLRA
ncbi:YbgA family protein [Arsukibacterium sp.]|uniref:YbgA family protein n=1 Tax=Arsukibacterium sp. TaxID=1977258 RepID=UPI002FDA02EA